MWWVLVALVWGTTNPLIRRGALRAAAKQRAPGAWSRLASLATTPAYVVPLALNLAGSALFYATLAGAPVAAVAAGVNALALVVSGVFAAAFLGERVPDAREALGMALVVLGVAICSSAAESAP